MNQDHHIHILGVCGTFMGGIAILARELGYRVTGSDANVYPPMSTQLEAQDIAITEGYEADQLELNPDQVVVGNAMSRGKPVVEAMLDSDVPYTSGPQWLSEHVLRKRWVLAVAGTHGKTSTSSMIAWILEYAKLEPGFLIGGVPGNFGISARLGGGTFFVVEADEYDTAFFDKRSKFVHYHPRTLVMNNLEFDHADIFDDLAAIQRQFHHVVRIVPGSGLIIRPQTDANLQEVIDQGLWSPEETLSVDEGDGALWHAELLNEDGSHFRVLCADDPVGEVRWDMTGRHNVANALAAVAAARHAGVPASLACEALVEFKGIKRRMELRGEVRGVRVYDDFAHHPTAIQTTLDGVRKRVGDQRVIAILEPRSNTMRMGVHQHTLADSLQLADEVHLFAPADIGWDVDAVADQIGSKARRWDDLDALIQALADTSQSGDHMVVMSNGGFGGIHHKLLDVLEQKP